MMEVVENVFTLTVRVLTQTTEFFLMYSVFYYKHNSNFKNQKEIFIPTLGNGPSLVMERNKNHATPNLSCAGVYAHVVLQSQNSGAQSS